MLPSTLEGTTDLKETEAWGNLKEYFDENKNSINIVDMFDEDSERFDSFSVGLETPNNGFFLFDYSKNRINGEVMELLMALAKERGLEDAREAMFNGEQINFTEGRAVMHVALRNSSNDQMMVDGQNIMPEIKRVQNHMKKFCEQVISGKWKGYTGKKITDVVNIGIGGSHLGPLMVTEALKPYATGPNVHFVSNIDPTHIEETLKDLSTETTLFLISCKNFNAQETMMNAKAAKDWFMKSAKNLSKMLKHFVAMSANEKAVKKFGIDRENWFEVWDWVGCNFSLWSSLGLSIALNIGWNNYQDLLDGGHWMDNHFKDAPLEENIPVLLSMLGIWYSNFYGAETQALLPYDRYMHRFADYFQQGIMDCNGKCITRSGEKVNYSTAPVIWGRGSGNQEHAFHQLLNQGARVIPCDFIAHIKSHNDEPAGEGKHHELMLCNFLAQTEALMKGKDQETVEKEMQNDGYNEAEIEFVAPHKTFCGNRPSNSFLWDKMTPFSLGAMIAMYEHKIFTQGIIWNINSYDHWGTELGKQLAKDIEEEMAGDDQVDSHDCSTNGLINHIKQRRNLPHLNN
jgi:glucose-6-phosphate isomerase